MPYAMVPAFYARLGALGTVDARALQWTILTGARASEAIGGEAKAPATWGEITKIDGQFTWVIDGSRMKGKQTHRVPSSAAAVALLGKRQADNVPLFKVSSADALIEHAESKWWQRLCRSRFPNQFARMDSGDYCLRCGPCR
jgi:integrase